jgi:hypothetical protein
MRHQSSGNGYKIAAIAIIWSFATGMLAICIQLVSITKSGMILPLAVILGRIGVRELFGAHQFKMLIKC